MERLISASGLLVFIGLGYVLLINRRAIRWQPVLWGIASQLILAVLILRTESCSFGESGGGGLGNLSGRV